MKPITYFIKTLSYKSCACPLRHTVDFTSLHKNHPGLLTAMMTAPDLSHRDLAFRILISGVSKGGKRVKELSNRLNTERIPTEQ